MTDRKPTDDLKDGLALIFRAARGAVHEVSKDLDVRKVETAINTGAQALARTIEEAGKSLNQELEKSFRKGETGEPSPPKGPQDPPPST